MKRSAIMDAVTRLKEHRRKGVFFVLAIVSLVAAMAFVGLSVDLGMITVTQTRMQATADAAALGAVQEIVVGIREAGEQGVTELAQVQAIAAAAARDMADEIVTMNGFYVDPETDVELGNRLLNEDGVTYTETWGSPPYNVVKVTIRKTNSDATAADAKLPLMFAPVTGERAHAITADATAFIESRDIVAVLDYSGSMTFDSQFRSDTVDRMGVSGVADSLDDIWDALVESDVRFSDDSATEKFPTDGFGDIDSYYGTYVSSSSTNTIFEELGLGGTEATTTGGTETTYNFYDDWTWEPSSYYGPRYTTTRYGYQWRYYPSPSQYTGGVWRKSSGSSYYYKKSYSTYPDYFESYTETTGGTTTPGTGYVPFPQEGKDSNGNLKGKPSESESETLWKNYISHVKSNYGSYGYNKRYGYRTLMEYLVSQRRYNNKSEDLWRAPVYPFHAMKTGVNMLSTFLDNLGYGDHLGLVTYASTSKIETGIDDDGADTHIDLGDEHLTEEVMDINTIHSQHQAGHYGHQATGIGYGLEDAKELLEDQGRYGAQKAILLITDGQSNQYPSGWGTSSLPSGWDWDEITDFDGDDEADVVINSSYVSGGNGDGNWRAALHSFVRAKEAYDAGFVVHTISAGDGADTVLMDAIAQMSGGEYVHIPSGSTNEEMEEDLEAAFAVLAGQVPPARLLIEDDE